MMMEQAAVTDWPARVGLTVLFVAIMALAIALMMRSWRRRMRAQVPLLPLPVDPGAATTEGAVALRYAGTSFRSNWLDRVAVADLSHRSAAEVTVTPQGLRIDRRGCDTLFIPAATIGGVGLGRGAAGRGYGPRGAILIDWVWRDQELTTSLRVADSDERQALCDRIAKCCLSTGIPAEGPARVAGGTSSEGEDR